MGSGVEAGSVELGKGRVLAAQGREAGKWAFSSASAPQARPEDSRPASPLVLSDAPCRLAALLLARVQCWPRRGWVTRREGPRASSALAGPL